MSAKAGRVESAVLRWLTKTANVVNVEILGDFRSITLEGEALQGTRWVPGEQVQMMLGGWAKRTYTPMSWDPTRGITEILAYAHGDGPGAGWVRSLAIADTAHLFGPQRSLDLAVAARPLLIFGDETSIGLASAVRHTARALAEVHVILEVTSESAVRPILERVGLSSVVLVERRSADTHVPELALQTRSIVQRERITHCVLSGKASSIQAVNRQVRELALNSKQIQSKPYWAAGKRGLD